MSLRRTTGMCFGLALVAACGSNSSNNANNTPTDDDGGGSSGAGSQSSGSSSGSSGSGAQNNGSSGSSGQGNGSSGSSGATSGSSSSTSGGSGSGGTHGDAGSDATAGGSSSSGGVSGSSGTGLVLGGDAGTCGAAPSGLTSNQSTTVTLVNQTRAAMGAPCATMQSTLNTSSTKHCTYYAANASSSTCIADAHVEVSSCTDYVAAQFYTRETNAGYAGSPSFEDMAFQDNATQALDEWINSVWHRTPILDPWSRDYGYGSATACDTMDFGVGAASPSDLIVTYPYNGQTGVPTSFNGAQEGPTPPVPPAGWPSGYPIHIYLTGVNPPYSGDPHPPPMATITTHELSVMGGAQLAHQWLTPTAYPDSLLDAVILYANAPLTANTTYLVHVAGTTAAGGPLDVNVTFTTQ